MRAAIVATAGAARFGFGWRFALGGDQDQGNIFIDLLFQPVLQINIVNLPPAGFQVLMDPSLSNFTIQLISFRRYLTNIRFTKSSHNTSTGHYKGFEQESKRIVPLGGGVRPEQDTAFP